MMIYVSDLVEIYQAFLCDPHSVVIQNISSLPNNKILNWSKLEAFADDKINVK